MWEYEIYIIITWVGTQLNDGQLSCVLSYTCRFVSLFHITLRQSSVIIIIIYDVYIYNVYVLLNCCTVYTLLYTLYYNKKWLPCFAQNKTRLTYAKHNMAEWRRLYFSQCSSILMSSTVYNIIQSDSPSMLRYLLTFSSSIMLFSKYDVSNF